MFGIDFHEKYKDNGAWCFSEDEGIFIIRYCLDTREIEPVSTVAGIILDEIPFEFLATVLIDMETGVATRDYENSRLPDNEQQKYL